MKARVRRMSHEKVLSEANITPLVDATLVLLIIFMITSQYMRYSIHVNVPKTDSPEKSVAKNEVVITITKDNLIYLADAKEPISKKELGKILKSEIAECTSDVVFLRSDGEVAIMEIIELSDIIRRSGGKVSLITKKKKVSVN